MTTVSAPGRGRTRRESPPPLATLVRRGAGALVERASLVAVCYLLQVLLSFGAAWIAARYLSAGFSGTTLLERATDGDLTATILALRHQPDCFAALASVGLAAVALYALTSCFVLGGLITVLLRRAESGTAVTHSFGSGATAMFFPFGRLGLLSAVPYGAALALVILALRHAAPPLVTTTRASELLGPLVAALLPALLLALSTRTALDYARIELTRGLLAGQGRRSATRALLRGYRLLLRSPRPALHVLLYYGAVGVATWLYCALVERAGLQPLLGASGAVSLLLVRQLLAIFRHAASFTLLAGQIELATALEPPLAVATGERT